MVGDIMTQNDLNELKFKISKLDINEQKLRDLYLRNISLGIIQGPMTGYASIDKPWLKYYDADSVILDLPKIKAYDYMYEKNKDNLNDIAIEFMGKEISYNQLFNNINRTAKSLLSLGVRKGDKITVAMATSPELAYLFYACNRIGATFNAIDPRFTYDEFKTKILETSSKYFFGINMSTSKVDNHREELGLKEVIEISPVESSTNLIIKSLVSLSNKKTNCTKWKNFIEKGKNYNDSIDSTYDETIPAVIVYTGGTTGIPKGVMLTNESLITMSYNNEVSIDYNYARGETMLNFLPPFSAYSIVNAMHDPLTYGFKTIMVPMFKPSDFPKLMRKYKPNHVLSGPILWDIMMRDKKCNKIDLSFLKSPVSGGDSMSEEFEKRINDYLIGHGCKYKIQQGYGMSEVSAAATYSTDKSYKNGSVGIPYFKNNISVFDVDTGEEKHANEIGEIRISTPTMMQGYNNNEDATKEIIKTDADGKKWINTGDLGYVDKDGNVFIKGRIKRLIVRSGNKIFPVNVENSILTIDEIENCAIVAMPDQKEKSVPVSFIVLKDSTNVSYDEVVSKIKSLIVKDMPDYNIPVKFIFIDSLPLTGMAKVDFKQLENDALDYMFSDEIVVPTNVKVK